MCFNVSLRVPRPLHRGQVQRPLAIDDFEISQRILEVLFLYEIYRKIVFVK